MGRIPQILLIAASLAPGALLAEEPSAGQETVALIADEDQAPETARAALAIRAQLTDLGVALRVVTVPDIPVDLQRQHALAERVADETGALLVVWRDFAAFDTSLTYMIGGGDRRVLTRKIDAESDGTLGRFEAIALVIRATVEAVLSGLPQLPPAEAPPREPTAKEPEGRIGAVFGLAYALGLLADERLLIHTAEGAIGARFPSGWTLGGAYSIAPGVEARQGDATIALTIHGARLSVSGEQPVGRLRLGGQLGVLVSFLDKTISTTRGSELEVEDDSLDVTVGMGIRLWLGVELGGGWQLFGGPDVVYTGRNVSYEVETQDGREVILGPWAVRPSLVVGLRANP